MLFASVMFIGLNASVKVQKEVPEEVAEPGTSGRTLEEGEEKRFSSFQMQRATGSSLVNEESVGEKQRYYLRVCTHAHVIIPN